MSLTNERRRKHPSYTSPFLFEILELTLIWIVFGLFEGTLDLFAWSMLSYSIAGLWVMYTLHKLNKVLDRQSHH
jgi:hypothetical protein